MGDANIHILVCCALHTGQGDVMPHGMMLSMLSPARPGCKHTTQAFASTVTRRLITATAALSQHPKLWPAVPMHMMLHCNPGPAVGGHWYSTASLQKTGMIQWRTSCCGYSCQRRVLRTHYSAAVAALSHHHASNRPGNEVYHCGAAAASRHPAVVG